MRIADRITKLEARAPRCGDRRLSEERFAELRAQTLERMRELIERSEQHEPASAEERLSAARHRLQELEARLTEQPASPAVVFPGRLSQTLRHLEIARVEACVRKLRRFIPDLEAELVRGDERPATVGQSS